MDNEFDNDIDTQEKNESDTEQEDFAVRLGPKILVVGVGGGGSNAINRMISADITSADFVAVNTDLQDLTLSKAKTKIQIGKKLTGGLGAGARPEVGEKAARESHAELEAMLEGVNMVFITAGMGGGTGTGAAPVIAELAKQRDILTVAVVTKPFNFEGGVRMRNAQLGLEKLGKNVDTLLVIPNQKLVTIMPSGTPVVECFQVADDVLRNAVQSLSDLIVTPTLINLDFADVSTIMKDRGLAHMGFGRGKGEDKMANAIRTALHSPLLETSIEGAQGVIINIVGGIDLPLTEIENTCAQVKEVVAADANIIFGVGIDTNLSNEVGITIIATGLDGGRRTETSDGEEEREETSAEEARDVRREDDVRGDLRRDDERAQGYVRPHFTAEPQPRQEQQPPRLEPEPPKHSPIVPNGTPDFLKRLNRFNGGDRNGR